MLSKKVIDNSKCTFHSKSTIKRVCIVPMSSAIITHRSFHQSTQHKRRNIRSKPIPSKILNKSFHTSTPVTLPSKDHILLKSQPSQPQSSHNHHAHSTIVDSNVQLYNQIIFGSSPHLHSIPNKKHHIYQQQKRGISQMVAPRQPTTTMVDPHEFDDTYAGPTHISKPLRIAFIGGGQMANALVKGLVTSDILPNGSHIIISDRYVEQPLSKQFPDVISSTTHDLEAIKGSDIVVLAVKPNVLSTVLSEQYNSWTGDEMILSVVAGVRLKTIRKFFTDPKQKLLRLLPNTPALVQCMAAGICAGKNVTEDDLQLVVELLEPLGMIKIVRNESYLDAVTGVSGSGPAYVFMLIEALADGGVQCGLSRQDSLKLASQAVMGAAKLVLETDTHPSILKDAVASPGGTTIAALKTLERNGFRSAIIEAVETACNRSSELGSPKESV